MEPLMTTVLTSDDPLYEELYDVRNEALEQGNLVEEDMNPAMCDLQARAAVQKGFLRDLLGLPAHHRNVAAIGRKGYTCFTFEVCNQVFRDYERFSSRIYDTGPGPQPALGILGMDEPDHKAYRAAVQPFFIKPQAFSWWRDRWIKDIVGDLIRRLEKLDRAELNLDLCARIPVHTITRAVGLEGDESLVFRRALTQGSSHSGSDEQRRAAGATVDRMLRELVARRRVAPADDLVSAMIGSELKRSDGTRPLTDDEIVTHLRLVLIAGGGTSWRQMGITLWGLLTNREQLEALKADRTLMEPAIDESARWNPTDPVFTRLVAQDTELAGVHLPAGSVLEICLGAANRDPARWEDPHAYNLLRPFRQHLGFGIGIHQCLGMNVGKAEIYTAINAMLDAFPNLRLDPDEPAPFLTGGLEQRGMSAIPVLLR
jgi:cytochrome P450